MTLEQAILDAVRSLPVDKQQEVWEHVRQLQGDSTSSRKPRKSGRGLWADLNIDVTAEEIDELRREIWENFPRDDF